MITVLYGLIAQGHAHTHTHKKENFRKEATKEATCLELV